MKYIDIHCHLNFPEYDRDREEVIARAQEEEIGIINVGTDTVMSEKAIRLAEKYENMWATVGAHPHEARNFIDFDSLRKMANHPKVVAIGECGLDYPRSTPEDIQRQKEIFREHIAIANEVNKPLMLHVRNGVENTGAYMEAVDMLKQYARVRANFHFFAGTMEDMEMIMKINATVSFTGVVTFARMYDEVIKNVLPDRIMSETDAPFVAPAPHRGKRNEPLYIKEISEKLCSIRGQSSDVFLPQIVDNARKMFGI